MAEVCTHDLSVENLERLHQFVLVAQNANDYASSWKAMIEFALYQEPIPRTIPAVKEFLMQGFGFGTLPEIRIEEYMSSLTAEGSGRLASTYSLADSRRASLRKSIETSKKTRRMLEDFLVSEIKKHARIQPSILRDVRQALAYFFALFLESRSVALLNQLIEHPELPTHGYLQYISLSAQSIRSKRIREAYSEGMRKAIAIE